MDFQGDQQSAMLLMVIAVVVLMVPYVPIFLATRSNVRWRTMLLVGYAMFETLVLGVLVYFLFF